jgi:hypothetical protein
MAKDAIDALECRALAAESRANRAEATCVSLARKLEEAEERMYGPTARAITRYIDVSNESDFRSDMQRICLRPQTLQFAIMRQELFDSKLPVDVIDHNIERVLKMHTDDLRKQLRAAVWPRR